jgi:hypothetical protein
MPRLKRLDATDLLTIPNETGDLLVVTKQEVANIIRKFIQNEIGNLPDEISKTHKDELIKHINQKISIIEKELSAFIDYKFDALAEKACEMLISRKFTEEVESRVQERAEKLINQKILKKGKF